MDAGIAAVEVFEVGAAGALAVAAAGRCTVAGQGSSQGTQAAAVGGGIQAVVVVVAVLRTVAAVAEGAQGSLAAAQRTTQISDTNTGTRTPAR